MRGRMGEIDAGRVAAGGTIPVEAHFLPSFRLRSTMIMEGPLAAIAHADIAHEEGERYAENARDRRSGHRRSGAGGRAVVGPAGTAQDRSERSPDRPGRRQR